MKDKLFVYTDGGSRGNPGPSAIGIVFLNENKNLILEYKEYIGKGTNNQAEYKALIKALEIANKYCKEEIFCFLDSELVIKQLNGKYKIKNKKLKELFNILKNKENSFKKVSYSYVKRTNKFIQYADKLVNQVLNKILPN